MITLGIENLSTNAAVLKGKCVGLIANATSVDRNLVPSVELLLNRSDFNLTTLFGPQQGFWGETQDNMVEWKSSHHPKYNLPLYSLYGENRKPTADMLKDVDILIFDIQDIGTRIYTYIWTMVLAMQACAELGREFIVCDRPNPLNGIDVEGNVSSLDFTSFVALYPMPLRHGMTVGEIATYVNEEFEIGCRLKIIQMKGWKRKMWYEKTELPWVIPSANMPTMETATVYPGMVIFEGTNISEGRGTTRPFEFVGAPFISGFELADALKKYELPGVIFRPCVFIPTFHKFAGTNCGGLQLHVTNRQAFRPVLTALAILKTIKELYPNDFEWKKPPYEYTYNHLPIDMIFGSDWIRLAIESGSPLDEITEKMGKELDSFELTRQKYLLY